MVVHELAHTAQCERLGSFEPFPSPIPLEMSTVGYPDAPLGHPVVSLNEPSRRGKAPKSAGTAPVKPDKPLKLAASRRQTHLAKRGSSSELCRFDGSSAA